MKVETQIRLIPWLIGITATFIAGIVITIILVSNDDFYFRVVRVAGSHDSTFIFLMTFLSCFIGLFVGGWSHIIIWEFLGLAIKVEGKQVLYTDQGEILSVFPRKTVLWRRSKLGRLYEKARWSWKGDSGVYCDYYWKGKFSTVERLVIALPGYTNIFLDCSVEVEIPENPQAHVAWKTWLRQYGERESENRSNDWLGRPIREFCRQCHQLTKFLDPDHHGEFSDQLKKFLTTHFVNSGLELYNVTLEIQE